MVLVRRKGFQRRFGTRRPISSSTLDRVPTMFDEYLQMQFVFEERSPKIYGDSFSMKHDGYIQQFRDINGLHMDKVCVF